MSTNINILESSNNPSVVPISSGATISNTSNNTQNFLTTVQLSDSIPNTSPAMPVNVIPLSFYQRYKPAIWAGVMFLFVVLTVVGALLGHPGGIIDQSNTVKAMMSIGLGGVIVSFFMFGKSCNERLERMQKELQNKLQQDTTYNELLQEEQQLNQQQENLQQRKEQLINRYLA